MTVVLAHPPAEAEADAEVTEQNAKDVATPPGRADLPVPGIVAEESELRENNSQEDCHCELPPRIAHQHEGGPASGQQPYRQRNPAGVAPRPPLHQTGLP